MALVGKNDTPSPWVRNPEDEAAPSWVRETDRRIELREEVSPEVYQAFHAWCCGEDVAEPEGTT